ncbi:MAG TPA: hypothetical protein PKO38_01955 [Bacillota bacterium]|nr:hypothetical protein [Bacillota bacterium]HOP69251.1 hypothetical protein [Bacillota bacterium]HPT34111.1 hypothetical protein [Bacillota bacterium]HPZ65461.1 hypothetical protein [Bacillota bacterium]
MGLELLWELQEKDLAIRALEEELQNTPLLEETEALREEVRRLQEEHRGAEERFKEEKRRLRALEMDIQKKTGERDALRRKLYGGEVSNLKELEQMEKKLNLLILEVDHLEEAAIEKMESLEKMEQELAAQAEQVSGQEEHLQEMERRLEALQAELRERLEALQEEREQFAGRLEPQYLERYRILSQKHQGRGVARVVDDICEGCRVFISSKLKGQLYNPKAMVYCENCGRLLIRQG